MLLDPKDSATDLTAPARLKLAAAFTADSPYISTLSDLLTGSYVNEDHGERPGPHGTVQTTSLLRLTQVIDADHVSFVFCTYNDGADFKLSTGKAGPAAIGIVQGTGDAVRANGAWLLYRLRQLTAVTEPAGTSNPCAGLAAR